MLYINRYSIRSSQAAFCDQPLLSYGSFTRTSCAVFWGAKETKIRTFWTIIFRHRARVRLQKVKKKNDFEYNGYKVYLTKATSWTLFTRNTQIWILSEISDMPKIVNVIYRPDIQNLQTIIISFPDQEKLLEKVDDGWT